MHFLPGTCRIWGGGGGWISHYALTAMEPSERETDRNNDELVNIVELQAANKSHISPGRYERADRDT